MNNCIQRESLHALMLFRKELQDNLVLREQFERDPQSALPAECKTITIGTDNQNRKTFAESIDDTPLGLRYVTLDRLVRVIAAQADIKIDDAEAVPLVVWAGFNAVVAYNGAAIGNAVLYHEAAVNTEAFINAVVRFNVKFTGKSGSTPQSVKTELTNKPHVILSSTYMTSDTHNFLVKSGVSAIREKMLLRTILTERMTNADRPSQLIKDYTYNGVNFTVNYQAHGEDYEVTHSSLLESSSLM